MQSVILVIHLFIAVGLVGLILMQRSEGGALGMGGGGGGGLMSGRAAGNLITRSTTILAALFFATSISLTWLAGTHREPASVVDAVDSSVLDDAAAAAEEAPVSTVPTDE